jgi:hypothetical protein
MSDLDSKPSSGDLDDNTDNSSPFPTGALYIVVLFIVIVLAFTTS